jgi:hypothetical protein
MDACHCRPTAGRAVRSYSAEGPRKPRFRRLGRLPLLGMLLLGLAMPAAAAGASVVETHQPFAELLFNPCTGEDIVAQGFIHSKAHISAGANGSTHYSLEVNLQNVKGVSTTGARYVVVRDLTEHTNADSEFAPFSTHFNFTEHYARLGENGSVIQEDDFLAYFRLHLTVNANGTTTVERLESDAKCN